MSRVSLLDHAALDVKAAEWLRAHRHGVDTSEAYDDLRALLSAVRLSALEEAASLIDRSNYYEDNELLAQRIRTIDGAR
jgi:hypothetical protein